jgi:hypothetical protein
VTSAEGSDELNKKMKTRDEEGKDESALKFNTRLGQSPQLPASVRVLPPAPMDQDRRWRLSQRK